LVGYMALFIAVAVFFVFIHLVAGRFIRPVQPDPEKLTIYECGEPTIGSSWIQFDLPFYVVALLFVIFDVEVAFFFPWAAVFGEATQLLDARLSDPARMQISEKLLNHPAGTLGTENVVTPAVAHSLALSGLVDILVFFGVLLVGFAYVWKRGDLDWVRALTAEKAQRDAAARPGKARPASTDRKLEPVA